MAVTVEPQVPDIEQFFEAEFLTSTPPEEPKGVDVALADVQADTDSTAESVLPITNASIHQGSWEPPDIQQAYLASSILVDEGEGLPVRPPPDGKDRLGLESQDISAAPPSEASLFFNTLADTSSTASIEEIIKSALSAVDAGPIGSSSSLPLVTLPSNQTGQVDGTGETSITATSDAGATTLADVITSADEEQILPLGILFPGSDQSPGPTPPPLPPLFTEGPDIVDFNTVAPGSFLSGSQFDALAGDDLVTLPETLSSAAALGFNVLSFAAGEGDDTITVGSLGFEVGGNAGSDSLIGGSGDDVLKGEDDNDFLQGGAGADSLDGGTGFDTANYSNSPAAIDVDLEAPVQQGGDAQGDVLINIDGVIASALNDIVRGNANNNVLEGGAGDDILEGRAGADTLQGNTGFDTASYESSAAAIDVDLEAAVQQGGDAQGDVLIDIDNVIATALNDIVRGNAGDNVLEGGAGDDTLEGREGVNSIEGDGGNDTASYESLTEGVTANLTTGTATTAGASATDTLSNIENLIGSDFSDALTGDGGVNILTGGVGDDVLAGLAGADDLRGGIGTDTADYSASALAVTVNLINGTGSGGDAAGDVLSSIENVTGSAQADVLVGDVNANVLSGGAGDDFVLGNAGADVLQGGTGTDTALYVLSPAGVTIDLAAGTGSGGTAEGDVLTDIENVIASNQADVLRGDAGVNVLSGRVGDDILEGRAGADVLQGDSGVDTASYESSMAGVTVNLTAGTASGGDAEGDTLSSIENLTGSAQADVLVGDANVNVLAGGAGNDLMLGGAGADDLQGGTGTDTAFYFLSPAAVTVDLATGTGSGGTAEGDVLTDIENLFGSSHDDVLRGDAGVNVLTGHIGNDTLEGRAGADTLQGSAGDDTLQGGAGADNLQGDAGIDTADYSTSALGVTVNLIAGTGTGGDAQGDVLSGIENVTGSAQADVLIGDANANVLSGGAGDDLMLGFTGADTLQGGTGTDTVFYVFSPSGVTVDLAAGTGSGGTAEGDVLTDIENVTGSNQADVLRGDAGVNVLTGGASDDILEGRAGADSLIGGAGIDTATYIGSSTSVTVNLTTGVNTGGDAQGDTLITIENITGSAFADTLTGDANVNVLAGGAGNDVLEGRAGADTLQGDAGNDTATYVNSSAGVTVNLTTNINSGGDAAGDVLSDIENVTGSAQADTLTGDGNANVLTGGDGNDIIEGRAGADVLSGNAGTDTVSYENSGAFVNINLATGAASGGDATGDTLSGFENVTGSAFNDVLTGIGSGSANVITGLGGADTISARAGADTVFGGTGNDSINAGGGSDLVFGEEGADTIQGNGGADTLFGDAGDDIISGGGGSDIIEGGTGADALSGNTGNDTVSYESSSAAVTVDLSTNTASGGDATGDTISGFENVTGSAFNDVLTGTGSANVITGGAGIDVINAGGGGDTVFGDAGNDVISGNGGGDTIEGGIGADTISGGAGADTLAGGAGTDTLSGDGGSDVFLFDVGNDANTVFGGTGNTDVLSLSGVTSPADWTLVLSTGSIVSQGVDFINFSPDAAGTLTYNDMTTTITFSEMERIIW